MFNSIKSLFGMGPSVDFKDLSAKGATIIDVRSKAEYASGHIKGSINIPLDTLQNNLSKIKKNKISSSLMMQVHVKIVPGK